MLHNDTTFHTATEAAVGEVEAQTDAEIIVVAASRSGSYRDLSIIAGAVAAWVGLGFLLYSPLSFSPMFIPFELAVLGLLVGWAVDRSPGVLTRLASRARKERQVASAAAAAFHEEAVHGTRGRTGLLVYVSALEDRVMVIPDAGILSKLPQGELNTLRWGDKADPASPGDVGHFVGGLKALGALLHHRIPAVGDNPDEMANAPRIRS